MDKNTVTILGLTRNSEETIEIDIKRIVEAFSSLKITNFHVIESDSNDRTVEKLKNIQTKVNNLNFSTFGSLELDINNKIERLCFLRNELIKILKTLTPTKYVVFVDLDNINNKITKKSVDSCFKKNNWSGCFPSQKVGYYDIFALRAENWNEFDCFSEVYKSRVNSYSFIFENTKKDEFYNLYVLNKMKKINPKSSWIDVKSAFGGVGIYKYEFVIDNFYDLTFSLSEYGFECEHVNFNKRIIDKGGKLFINPEFINSKFNEHNSQLKFGYNFNKLIRSFRTKIFKIRASI